MRIDESLGRSVEVDTITNALVESNDRLVAVYELIGFENEALDGHGDIERLIAKGCELLGADWGVFIDQTEPAVTSGAASEELQWLCTTAHTFATSGGSAHATTDTGLTATMLGGAVADRAFTVGFARSNAQRFSVPDRRLAGAISETIAGVLRTQAMHHSALAEAEHRTAAHLAQMVLPTTGPVTKNLDIYASTIPARAAGGDFYASYESTQGDLDVFHFVVGDVSGKGLPAALMMGSIVSASNVAMRHVGDQGPNAVLRALETATTGFFDRAAMFATVVVGRVWPQLGVIEVANAGHDPVILWRGAEGVYETVGASTPPLGVVPIPALEPTRVLIAPGDLCLIGSDGLTEQVDRHGAMFGTHALAAVLGAGGQRSSWEIGEGILGAVDAFAQGSDQSDDRTVTVLQVNWTP